MSRIGLFVLLLAAPLQQAPVEFERDIRPIFRASCLKCHGAEGKPKGQLRLDLRAAAFRGGAGGKVIVPGKSTESPLYKLLVDPDDDARMPQKAPRLSPEAIGLVRRWIDEGASWPEETNRGDVTPWSLRPLVRPAVPAARWGHTPVDAFIATTLKEKGLQPSPEADRRTLLRRVTYDLTGLPPTPEEMDAFLADASADAYDKVVDRLLASPRLGERWARHWLDAVHYADTHGHDQDRPREYAWPYRDYVIRAFNDDKPYARFVEEQIAGDVLRPGDPQALVATGFLAAGPWDESSQMHIMADTVDKKIAQNLDRDDMLTATMSTFMATTVQCARCHNHKFDPISQAEYYALQSCFAGVDRANRPFDDDPALNRRRQDLLRKKTGIAVRRKTQPDAFGTREIEQEVQEWERGRSDAPGFWTVLDPVLAESRGGATLTRQPDGSLLSTGAAPDTDVYTITVRSTLRRITAVRLETLTVEDHPYRGPGREDNGNFHLSEFRLFRSRKEGPPEPVDLRNPTADFSQAGWSVAQALDGKAETAWAIYPEVGKNHFALFELREPLDLGDGESLVVVLEQLQGKHRLIAHPRLSATSIPPPFRAEPLPPDVAKIVALEPSGRSREQKVDLAAWVLDRRIQKELDALPKPRLVYAAANDFAPIAKFSPARTPRPIFVLKRGDVTKPGEEATPGGLACVPGLSPVFAVADPADEGARRAALAAWLVDPKNVLTWRTIVNRVWHHHFGRGIADSPNDLGRMGAAPTHPELLDWLAVEFRDGGGSLKKLHRLIVTSAVYRQTSTGRPDLAKGDAPNLYLGRMNRLRLDAEEVRDSILALSGKLDPRAGGPSVKQFHYEDPNPGVTPKVDYGRYDVDHPDNFRRSIYRWIFRTLPDPFMETLDCPDASQLTGARNVSITPLQAMAVLNDRFVIRQSEHLAARLAGEGEVLHAYRLVLQRPPTAGEASAIRDFAMKRGLANAVRILLNSNEFMFLD
ncbi:MAG TPA: PSD1 and planctomycete cytochrome C domain-containing protein [Planctomycetota bacterium]|nr:PSD1 and planctomycete cytochrome C domain-containing protein [Planctomycetota bacterium]